ncbi:MAG: hypothetical protein HQL80_11960 [Magnetococcales bacterium]|nr:hypothetical protein [Magnetococcales bacterium]
MEERTCAEKTVRETSFKGTDRIFEPLKLPKQKLPSLRPEQVFEGVVLTADRENGAFWARLKDCTADMPDEEAAFSFDEISAEDRPLIVAGALFSWHIGLEQQCNGIVRRVSEIRFRRFSRFFRLSAVAIARSAERSAVLKNLIAESYGYPAVNTSQA